MTKNNEKHSLDVLVEGSDKKDTKKQNESTVDSADELPGLVDRLKAKQEESKARKMLILPKGDNLVGKVTETPGGDEAVVNETDSMDVEQSTDDVPVETDSNAQELIVPLSEDIVSVSLIQTNSENVDKCESETKVEVSENGIAAVNKDTEKCVPEPDSGYLTTPAHSSGEDSNGSGKEVLSDNNEGVPEGQSSVSVALDNSSKVSMDTKETELSISGDKVVGRIQDHSRNALRKGEYGS